MRRLTARGARRRPSDGERGAVAATVAIVLGCGVLLGMAAIVVDVGQLYAEREELQTGADAAAMAVAEECVRTPARCTEPSPTAAGYAGSNARDGAVATMVCGRGGDLDPCSPPAVNHTACLGDPPPTGSYVEVRTATRLPDGSTLLPTAFAAAFTGMDEGTEVGACARAAWGAAHEVNGLALTISTCEWADLTDDGETLWPAPEFGAPPASAERIIYFKDNTTTTCPAGPSGWDAPGAFGRLDDPAGNCRGTFEVNGAYSSEPGNGVPDECKDALQTARDQRQVMYLPVYDGVRDSGTNTTYHLAGFAAFVITGYNLSGFPASSWLTGRQPCTGSDRCMSGYFIRSLVTTPGAIGGPAMGVSIVKLVG